jgi:hypothetical protein
VSRAVESSSAGVVVEKGVGIEVHFGPHIGTINISGGDVYCKIFLAGGNLPPGKLGGGERNFLQTRGKKCELEQ